MRRLLSILVALGLVMSFSLVTAVPAQGAPINVPGDYSTIQAAITAANPGDTIYVAAGTYTENITLANGVDVLGAGAYVTIINGGGSGHVVNSDAVNSTTTIDGFTITGGGTNYGGGVYNDGASPVVSNCIITGNTAANFGGGIYNLNGSSPLVVNCIIAGNTATLFHGGGIYTDASSTPTIINCTIAGNSASQGGGIYAENPTPTITNNIIANNTATSGRGIYCASGTLIIDHNDVHNDDLVNCTSTNGSTANPLFVNEAGGDYHIQPTSPCIDAGDNGAVPADTADLDGDGNTAEPMPYDFEKDPRFFDGNGDSTATVDMGADEYYVAPPPPPGAKGVGGEVYPVDKTALLLPWLFLSAMLVLAAGGLILVRRRR
jgi:parallel beta-helix repeat protein